MRQLLSVLALLSGRLRGHGDRRLGREGRKDTHLTPDGGGWLGPGLSSVPGLEGRVHSSVSVLCLFFTPVTIQDAPQSQVYEWDSGMHLKFN